MRKKIIQLVLFSVLTIIAFNGCKRKDAPVKIAKPHLSETQTKSAKQTNINILRYEKDLFGIDQNNMAAAFAAMYGKYPDNIVAKGSWNNTEMLQSIKGFINDPVIKQIYKDSQAKYGDLSGLKSELESALSIYLSHFPNEKLPDFCTLVSGIDFQMPSVFGYQNTIFICIDMYLGKDYTQYSQAGMPNYIAARCESKYIATDCFSKALAYRHLPDITLVTLLDNMIDAGKKLFFTQTMFPSVPTVDILGYSKEKYQWATSHESAVWHYFIEKDLVYSNDDNVIRRMIDETPFTREFGNASPGRIGQYLGLQIVKSYVKNHPAITLKELMSMTDSQKILKESGYKPQ